MWQPAFLLASSLLLIGLFLRARLTWMQRFALPAAIVGGVIGWMALQGGLATAELGLTWLPAQAQGIVVELRTWPGGLIAVVFAGMFLQQPAPSLSVSLRGAVRQGNMVWIIGLGQVALGLLAVWLIIQPLQLGPDDGRAPLYFGHLIEAGFVGGHGTSAALGQVYKRMGYAEAQDFAFFMATAGLLYSVVSGVFFVNLGIRRGWTRTVQAAPSQFSGLEARQQSRSLGHATVNPEVLDPLAFQVLLLASAYGLGVLLQQVVGWAYDGFPLFLYTLLGGWVVRRLMSRLGGADLLDPPTLRRLVATAMEFLIVAAIASLNLSLISDALVPLMILFIVAAVWTAICLMYLGRRLLPTPYWFELGVLNYGMSTGVTASGLMLLRMVDPDFESGAAEDYSLAAPLFTPFVGGGLVTVVVVPWMLKHWGIGPTALVTLALTCGLCGVGWILARADAAGQPEGPPPSP